MHRGRTSSSPSWTTLSVARLKGSQWQRCLILLSIKKLKCSVQVLSSQCCPAGSLLHKAVEMGQRDAVRALLLAGADPGLKNSAGETSIQVEKKCLQNPLCAQFFNRRLDLKSAKRSATSCYEPWQDLILVELNNFLTLDLGRIALIPNKLPTPRCTGRPASATRQWWNC